MTAWPRCSYCPLPATCRTAELAYEEWLCGRCCTVHAGHDAAVGHAAAEGANLAAGL